MNCPCVQWERFWWQRKERGDGQISSIQAIHGTEKGNFDHQMELLLYRPPFIGVKSQMNSRVAQNLLNELFQLHREIGSRWMKSIHKLLYFI
jgi:hypothetical protein